MDVNLQIESLKTGGIIKFDMMDGSFINIDILECQLKQVLEFTWDKDRVRFGYKGKIVLFYS